MQTDSLYGYRSSGKKEKQIPAPAKKTQPVYHSPRADKGSSGSKSSSGTRSNAGTQADIRKSNSYYGSSGVPSPSAPSTRAISTTGSSQPVYHSPRADKGPSGSQSSSGSRSNAGTQADVRKANSYYGKQALGQNTVLNAMASQPLLRRQAASDLSPQTQKQEQIASKQPFSQQPSQQPSQIILGPRKPDNTPGSGPMTAQDWKDREDYYDARIKDLAHQIDLAKTKGTMMDLNGGGDSDTFRPYQNPNQDLINNLEQQYSDAQAGYNKSAQGYYLKSNLDIVSGLDQTVQDELGKYNYWRRIASNPGDRIPDADKKSAAASKKDLEDKLGALGYSPNQVQELADFTDTAAQIKLYNESMSGAQTYAKEHPGAATFLSFGEKLAGGAESFVDLLKQNLSSLRTNPITGEKTPMNYQSFFQVSNGVANTSRSTVESGLKSNAGLYRIGTYIGDAGSALLTPAAEALLGCSAAADAAIGAHERGATDGQALTLSLISGATSYAASKFPIDKLLKLKGAGDLTGLAKFKVKVGNVLAQSFGDGMSSVANAVADTVGDALVLGDKSQYDQLVRKYENGYTDADSSYHAPLSAADAQTRALTDRVTSTVARSIADVAAKGGLKAIGSAAKKFSSALDLASGIDESIRAKRALSGIDNPGKTGFAGIAKLRNPITEGMDYIRQTNAQKSGPSVNPEGKTGPMTLDKVASLLHTPFGNGSAEATGRNPQAWQDYVNKVLDAQDKYADKSGIRPERFRGQGRQRHKRLR